MDLNHGEEKSGPVSRPGVEVVPGQEAGHQGQQQGTQPADGGASVPAHDSQIVL